MFTKVTFMYEVAVGLGHQGKWFGVMYRAERMCLTAGINCEWPQQISWLTCAVQLLAWVLAVLSEALVVFLRPCRCWFSIFISSLYANHPVIL